MQQFEELPADAQIEPIPDGFEALPDDAQLEPAHPSEGGGEVQFNDDPAAVATKLSPEDEAHRLQLNDSGSADQIAAFLHSKGFTTDQAALQKYVTDRDAAKAQHRPYGVDGGYARPQAPDQGAAAAFENGISQGASLGTSDEIHGFLNGVTELVKGGSYTDAYNRTVDQDRAQLGADEENHGIASALGNLAGGAVLPVGLERAGVTASMDAVALAAGKAALREGLPMAEARAIAARAVGRRLAAEGGAYGAAYGAGSAEGGPSERLLGAAEGGAAGVAGGVVAGQASKLLPNVARVAATNPGAETAEAAARLGNLGINEGKGIDLLPADVGGPITRRLTGAAAQAPLSASPIVTAAQRMTGQAQSARDTIAASIGQALDPEAAGLAIRTGAQRYIADSGADIRSAYRAAETLAGDAKVSPTQAIAALDRNIGELAETPGGAPGLSAMQGLRDQLAAGDVTPAGLLRMRTVLRDQFMKDGLVGSDTERRVGQVLDAANTDVLDGLRAAGKPEAASAYAAAASKYKQRITTINNVLEPIIGSRDNVRSGEAVVRTMMADFQGNNARAVKLLKTLPPEEQATTRASIIGSLGRKQAGGQNAAGNEFSLSDFLTHWNKIGETAKRAYFGDEARSALNDLATVADATKHAQKYANHSNTAGGIWGNLGILASSATVAPVASAVGGVTQLIGGKLLASPRFARWLARAPKTSLSPRAYAERLGRFAKAEPAIASDLLAVQRRIVDGLSSSPARAAAQEPGNETSRVNGNTVDQNGNYQDFQP